MEQISHSNSLGKALGKRFDMKRLWLAAAMTAFVVNGAWAADVNTAVSVTRDVVTVGDIFAGVTHDAEYILAPAPAFGKTLTLNAGDLQRISDAFSLGWLAPATPVQVTVRRAGSQIETADIEGALQSKLAEQLQERKFDMQLSDRGVTFFVPEGKSANIAVSGLKYDLNHGDFSAEVTVAGHSRPISGRLYPVTSVPVLRASLQQGDIISAEDIEYVDIRNSELAANVITDPEKLVGMAPRRGIASLKPVTPADVALPQVVKKGELVTMVLQSDTMTLTAQGKALSSAAVGETVKIVNAASGQAVDGVVTGPKTVSVRAPDSGI